MAESIFSSYKGGENRITSSILAVLRSLALTRMEGLLGSLLEQAEFELVRFTNQPKGDSSVPDAEIACSCQILIEAKIQRGAVDQRQIERHLQGFNRMSAGTQILLVLTPDDMRPSAVEQVQDQRVVWASFAALDQAIEELLGDASEVTSEREAFLLRELQTMLMEEGLLRSPKNVVVVAARRAWDEYLRCGAYVCQPGRPFQPVDYLAFYKDGQILATVPRVLDVFNQVDFAKGKHRGRLADVIEVMIDSKLRLEGASQKVFLLTGPEDLQTKRLNGPIPNDLRSESGRPVAFTQGQRYVSLDDLLKAASTAELVTHGLGNPR